MKNQNLELILTDLERIANAAAKVNQILISQAKGPLFHMAAAMAPQLLALHREASTEEFNTLVAQHIADWSKDQGKFAEHRQALLDDWKKRGAPSIWQRWHKRALNWRSSSMADNLDDSHYITSIINAIPCGDCKQHFLELLKADPPQWGEKYFWWTVRIHNAVNQKLGKPIMSTEEARLLYA